MEQQVEDSTPFQVLAVRHAQSEWNKIDDLRKLNSESKTEMKEKLRESRYQPLDRLADALITETGELQCLEMADDLLKYLPQIKVVLLSPNRRAVQTYVYAVQKLLKDKKIEKSFSDKIEVRVTPMLMPRLTDFIDFPVMTKESIEIAGDLKMDFEEIKNLMEKHGKVWCFEHSKQFVGDKQSNTNRLNKAIDAYNANEDVRDLFDYTEKSKKRMDTEKMVQLRLKIFKEYLREEYKEYGNGEILLVTHSGLIKRMFNLKDAENAKLVKYNL